MNCCKTFSHILKPYNLVLNFKRWYSCTESVSDFKVIVLLSILVISVLVVFAQFPEVFGSRDEIKSIKSEITVLEKRNEALNILISEQKITINSNESTAKLKKEELRLAKLNEGKSWIGKEITIKKEIEYNQSVQVVKDSNEKYLNLLQEKSDNIKKIKELDSNALKLQIQLQKETNPNPTGKAKIIGVDLSKSCITQNKNGIKSDCPTYLDLKSLDASKQEVSGYFETKNGYFSRTEPKLVNSWRFYDYDPTPRIIIDPPQSMSERIRLITIQDNFDTYLLFESRFMKQDYVLLNSTSPPDNWGNYTNYNKLDKQSVQVRNNTASGVIFHDRYVDERCKHAVINADKWLQLLPDTINFMRNNCDESFTSFNHKEIVTKTLTPQDITTTQKYKDEQRLKWIKENCLAKYGSCK